MRKIISILFFVVFAFCGKGQTITTIAGNGSSGYVGDGGVATSAKLHYPYGIAVDVLGNVYIADYYNNCIRKVNTNGIITTIAGGGMGGDGGAAISAYIGGPVGIAIDALGNLYITEFHSHRVRKINTNGIITTIAGTGIAGYSGNGGAATSAKLYGPMGVAVDALGNVYISDNFNYRIRKINTSGIISTIAGTSTYGYSGDGGAATSAKLNFATFVTVDALGNVYIADALNHRIRKVSTNGIITTVVGTGTAGYSGDGGAATSAQLNHPWGGMVLDATGNMYIADQNNSRIRKVNTNGIISTIAGTGIYNCSGDGGAATSAELKFPSGIAVDTMGNLYISDYQCNRVRFICNPSYYNSTTKSICDSSYIWHTSTCNKSGVYTYTYNNACGVISTDTLHLTINAVPTLSISRSSSTICVNESVALSADGANTYTWSTNQNSANINVSPSITTIYSVQGTDNNACVGGSSVTVFVDECTGIEKLKTENNQLKIYPNPTNEMLNVDISASLNVTEMLDKKTEIKVIDVLGRIILNKQLAISNGTTQINVSELQKGIYFVKAGGEVRKFVKE